MKKKNWLAFSLCLLLAGTALAAFFALSVPAAAQPGGAPATIIVNSVLDESDGSCSDGDCSLRDAVAIAAAGDTVGFSVTGVITLSLGQITLDKDVTIDGPGAGMLEISGNNASRIFLVNSGVQANISDLTIRDGKVSALMPSYEYGGGIRNQGTLTIAGLVISNNRATNWAFGGGIGNHATLIVYNTLITGNVASFTGGAIFNDTTGVLTVTQATTMTNNTGYEGGGAINNRGVLSVSNSEFNANYSGTYGGAIDHEGQSPLSIDDCTFYYNTAVWRGGGIHTWPHDGTLSVTNSRFTGNTATGNYPDGLGGGICNSIPGTINNSTFTGNNATEFGGGVYNDGVISFYNNTFFGNHSGKYGGGFANRDYPLTAANCTFTGNRADVAGGGFFADSTGNVLIHFTVSGNTAPTGANFMTYTDRATLKNSIIANPGSGANCGEAVIDGGGNLRWPASDSTCVGQYGNPALEPLAENLGATRTMALPPYSAAIDIGDNAACAAAPVNNLDQRGVTRPLDGDGDGHAVCDAGAFEAPAIAGAKLLYVPVILSGSNPDG